MATLILSEDGRTWWGRRRYRARLEDVDVPDGLNSGRMGYRKSMEITMGILWAEIAAGNPVHIVDNRWQKESKMFGFGKKTKAAKIAKAAKLATKQAKIAKAKNRDNRLSNFDKL